MEIKKTKNYQMFKKNNHNRNLVNSNLKRITASLKSHNLLEFRPILVNEKMEVLDGQHRLAAAQFLNFDIYYQIAKHANTHDVILLNVNQERWKIDDFINYFCENGNEDYIKLRAYCTKKSIHVYEYISFVRGARSQHGKKIRDGSFVFAEEQDLEDLNEIIDAIHDILKLMSKYVFQNSTFIKSRKMKAALSSLIKTEQVNVQTFKEKLTFKSDALHVCATTYGYYSMLRDIYNWKNHHPID